jgi:Icc-related predicted phosphoesterase
MGVLDLTLNASNVLERAGCRELWNRIAVAKPLYHLFGHIHNCKDNKGAMIRNQGVLKLPELPTTFMNSSVVEDGKFGILTNHGQIFEI